MTDDRKERSKPQESTAPLPGKKDRQEELLTEALEESMAASDPPQGVIPGSLLGKIGKKKQAGRKIKGGRPRRKN